MTILHKFFIGAAMAAPIFVMAPSAFAVDKPGLTDKKKPVQLAHAEDAALNDEQKAALKQRIDKLKANQKTRLSAADKQRFQSKCKNAQGAVHSVGDKIKGIETSREQVHANLVTRLNSLADKLQAGGADVSALEQQLVTLESLINTFKTDLTAYKQAVSDLSTMDCASDPDGFKAALDAARAAGAKVHEDSKAIKTHLNDVIKPALKTLRESMKTNEGEGVE